MLCESSEVEGAERFTSNFCVLLVIPPSRSRGFESVNFQVYPGTRRPPVATETTYPLSCVTEVPYVISIYLRMVHQRLPAIVNYEYKERSEDVPLSVK